MKPQDSKQTKTDRELKLAEQLIAALNLLRMNVGMYPEGHSLISQSLNYAFGVLQKIFTGRDQITIGVAGETLLAGEGVLDKENRNHKQFAQSLNDLSITSITLSRGLTKDELLKFQRILAEKPVDILASGDIEKVFAKNRLVNIKATYLYLSDFRFTEMKENAHEDLKEKRQLEDDRWQNYIASLITQSIDEGWGKPLPPDVASMDPQKFVKHLNSELINWDAFLDDYGSMIDRYLHSDDEEKVSKYRDIISKISSLIKDFHPQLKRQLLSITEKAISSQPLSSITLDRLGCFPYESITEILRSASDEKREMSPSLILLFQKMSKINYKSSDSAFDVAPDFSSIINGTPESVKELDKLIERERYESYVPADYEEMLRQKTGDIDVNGEIDAREFVLEEETKTLEDESLNLQVHRLLLALMDEDLNEDEYWELSTSITETIPQFLLLGQFPVLIDILEAYRRHVKEKSSGTIKKLASSGQAIFYNSNTISQALKPFLVQGIVIPSLIGFIEVCGPQNIPWLLDLYLEKCLPRGQEVIVELLRYFGKEAVDDVLKRLSGLGPHHMGRLLELLRVIGDAGVIPFVRKHLYHSNLFVRMQAISTLLRFHDPYAKDFLQKAILSKDRFESSHAIVLACHYRITEICVHLISQIKTVIIFEKDLALNEFIITEVVKTKDPHIVRYFEKLATARWSLFPGRLSLTKMALFRSLSLYWIPDAAKLIKAGLDSKDKRIKSLCVELMQNG